MNVRKQIGIFSLLIILSVSLFAEEMPTGYYNGIDGLKDATLKGTLRHCSRQNTPIEYGDDRCEVFDYTERDDKGY